VSEKQSVQETTPPEPSPQPETTVISTGDGDTLQVEQTGQPLTIRLACVDAPETDQPGGQEAATRLRELLPRGTVIELQVVDTDRYGRTVAEIQSNGQSVGLQMVREGQAIVYPQYLDGCADSRAAYLDAEAKAKQQQLAFWSQTNPIVPWEWRQGQRTTLPPTK
jgi:micrococcal nuclease